MKQSERNEQIKADYLKGIKMAEIAEKHFISYEAVAQVIRRYGIANRASNRKRKKTVMKQEKIRKYGIIKLSNGLEYLDHALGQETSRAIFY